MLTLDVVAKHLPVALGTSLSKSLSSLAAARHDCKMLILSEAATDVLAHAFAAPRRIVLNDMQSAVKRIYSLSSCIVIG